MIVLSVAAVVGGNTTNAHFLLFLIVVNVAPLMVVIMLKYWPNKNRIELRGLTKHEESRASFQIEMTGASHHCTVDR